MASALAACYAAIVSLNASLALISSSSLLVTLSFSLSIQSCLSSLYLFF